MDSSRPDGSTTPDSDINDIVMNDAVTDDVILDISLQNAIISTKFVDNFTQWTQDRFYVNKNHIPELERVGVDRYSELFLLGLNPTIKSLMAGSAPPTVESLMALQISSDGHNDAVGGYLQLIKTADGLVFMYAGGVWAVYGMDGRRISHNFAAACTSASSDHTAFLRQALFNRGKVVFIPAWSVPRHQISDVFRGLTLSLTVRVMELGLAVHFGAIQDKIIHYRSLINSTRTWSTKLPWIPLCTHSSLNEKSDSRPAQPMEREIEYPALLAQLEPVLLKTGWTKEKIHKFVRTQLLTAQEAKSMRDEKTAYNKERDARTRANMTEIELQDFMERRYATEQEWKARLRSIGAQPAVWSVERLAKHGLDVYLHQEDLSQGKIDDLKRQVRIIEKQMGYRVTAQAANAASRIKSKSAKVEREAVREQATNQSITTFVKTSPISSSSGQAVTPSTNLRQVASSTVNSPSAKDYLYELIVISSDEDEDEDIKDWEPWNGFDD